MTYNTPAVYNGFTFDNIRFEFKDEKIIKTAANNSEKLNDIFNTDDGATYIGEFGGGEIYFDDILIRKDGVFIIPELYCLNPENLA
ncbi:hypothetical protein CP523_11960 [Clostridium septicum]|uniref:Uncharacterized protein n=1 Tax=Clostridium septicum TaxID=1504 RepID=A0A9N7JNB7_CLOSE|nr:hypothetical protein CP523_11960 [Clostridium septicum]QAS62170.1 hypothetical protein EI377_06780 [Clostridium septicum]